MNDCTQRAEEEIQQWDFSSVSHLYPKALVAANSSKAKDLFYRRNSDLIKILLPDPMLL